MLHGQVEGPERGVAANDLFTICLSIWIMRGGFIPFLLIMTSLLTGCGPEAPVVAGAVVVASGASLPVFHRTPLDMAVSLASGRDCSVVNLDRGVRYCQPRELAPERPLFCTRSLGVPDCWASPEKLPGHPRQIADGPWRLTAEQEKQRTRWWPGLW